jgi:MATE family multidrug resistance protein
MPAMGSPWRADFKELSKIAGPVVAVQVGLMLMGVVDVLVVGRVSPEAMGAVGAGNQFVFTTGMLGMGTLLALDPIVAQAVGARDETGVARGLQRGLLLSLLMTPPTLALYALDHAVFTATGIPADVMPLAEGFVDASAPGVLAFFLFIVFRQTLQALGLLGPILWTILAGNVLNLFLNWVLVFGHLGAPPMGAVGSALSSTIGRWAQVALLVAIAWRALGPRLHFSRASFETGPLLRMVGLGLPIGLHWLMEVGVFSLVGLLMGRLGTDALAGHQVAINLASLTFMVPLGVGAAASVLVGRAVGREDAAGVKCAARVSLFVGVGFMALSATCLLLFPAAIASVYTNAPGVLAVAASLLPIAGVFQVFDGLQAVSGGILRGLGDTRVPFLAALVAYWLVGCPLSLYLGFSAGLGARGLWWGFVAGLFAIAAFLLWRIRHVTARPLRRIVMDLPGASASHG